MTISNIDPATPANNTPAGLGDDQIRALKQAIVDQFPGVTGDDFDTPLTVGPRTINTIPDKADQADLTALDSRVSTNELAILAQASTFTDQETRIAAIEADYTTQEQAENAAWPVGSIFISADGQTPTQKGIAGTWSLVGEDRFLFGGTAGQAGATGGSNNKTLAAANLPAHRHFAVASVVNTTPIASGGGVNTSQSITRQNDQGGSSFAYVLAGNAQEPTVGRTSETGSGDAFDARPAFLRVAFYRRTA